MPEKNMLRIVDENERGPGLTRRAMQVLGNIAVGAKRELAHMLSPDRRHRAVRIREEQPLHDAAVVGVSAIEHGTRRNDDQLREMGEAIVARAVAHAADSEHVPGHITQKVVQVAVRQEVNPQGNPYVPAEIADRASHTIRRYSMTD